jgi:hypothetical protein
MVGKSFINYRRDNLIGMAGRLHDRLAQTFDHFIDVNHNPAGADYWLNAKDEAGKRRCPR